MHSVHSIQEILPSSFQFRANRQLNQNFVISATFSSFQTGFINEGVEYAARTSNEFWSRPWFCRSFTFWFGRTGSTWRINRRRYLLSLKEGFSRISSYPVKSGIRAWVIQLSVAWFSCHICPEESIKAIVPEALSRQLLRNAGFFQLVHVFPL